MTDRPFWVNAGEFYDWAAVLLVIAEQWEPDASAILLLTRDEASLARVAARQVIDDFLEHHATWEHESDEIRFIEMALAQRTDASLYGAVSALVSFVTSTRGREDQSLCWMRLLRPYILDSGRSPAQGPPPLPLELLGSARRTLMSLGLAMDAAPQPIPDAWLDNSREVPPFDRDPGADLFALLHLRQSFTVMPLIMQSLAASDRRRLWSWARETARGMGMPVRLVAPAQDWGHGGPRRGGVGGMTGWA